MRVYLLKRLLNIVPTVLMITFVVFVMMRSVPGDPVVSLLGDAYTEEDAIKARAEYGLNKPIVVQYVIWLGKLAQGESPVFEASLLKDLGTSLEQSIPTLIADDLGGRPNESPSPELYRTLLYTSQIAPTFSLRGGTREILRGIIARGLGLR